MGAELMEKIVKDPKVRRAVTRGSHLLFFHVYFAHYIQYATAPFQKELFALTQSRSVKTLVVEAFRGSGKSTTMTLSLPLWAILGERQEKFVVILAKTQQQARQYLTNIKKEIESNDMLRRDLGPFEEQEDEWRTLTIVIPKYGARIAVASVDSSLRGMRHLEHRPGLVIADDLEDLESVRQQEQRDKLWQWYTGDVMPMGTDLTQFVVVGTRLHEDSLLMRLRKGIESGKRSGISKVYPIVDADGCPLWPGRFPTLESVEELRRGIADEATFEREYMLRIIPDESRVVRADWIRYFRDLPPLEGNPDLQMTLTGIDLAISKETSADFTAMVSVSVFRNRDGDWSIYIHPNPVNERLDYPETRQRIKEVSRRLGFGSPTPVHIESVGYQSAMVQDLRHEGFPAEEFKVHGQDKRMRLSLVTHLIKNGIVRFPERGSETLLNQLIGFGIERHDDLADAFAIALHIVLEHMSRPSIVIPKNALEQTAPQETEKTADEEARLYQEAARSGSPVAWQKYNNFMNEKRRQYWRKEEMLVFSRMTRRY
jgi:predicted phage terminase large subunit-like protein